MHSEDEREKERQASKQLLQYLPTTTKLVFVHKFS